MAIGAATVSAVEAAKERVSPALDKLDETIRQGRRVIVRGRHAAEDTAAAATLKIRRHPVSAVMIAAGAGIVLGAAVGFRFGWVTRGRK
jgi:ElaB/YqjD/DUF883 family membrane-anchored ribosome-binding protein